MKPRFTALLIVFAFAVHGQDLVQQERELTRLGKKSIEAKTQEERLAAADTFAMFLEEAIKHKEAFEYTFTNVRNLSKLTSPDNNFRIYTWSVPLRDGSFMFYGKIVTLRGKKPIITNLIDGAEAEQKPETKLLKAEQWYGAVYYDIIKTKNNGTTYYTLLGYRPNNKIYNQKVIEVISSANLQRLRFGDRIFNTPNLNGVKFERPPYRLILRYNTKAVAMLRWIPEEKHILLDHLVPPDASQKEQWNLYGPDFSYDALFWSEGMWQLNESVPVSGNIAPPAPQKPTQKGLPPKKR